MSYAGLYAAKRLGARIGLAVFLTCVVPAALLAQSYISKDRDYFVAASDPEAYRDLHLIEDAHMEKVVMWIREDKYHNAIAELQFTLDRFPNHPKALAFIETVARMTNIPTLPLIYYDKAISIYPEYALTHGQYGHYLLEIGKTDLAINKLLQAIKISPKWPLPHAWLAEAYVKIGKDDLAQKSREDARALGYKGDFNGTSQKAPSKESGERESR